MPKTGGASRRAFCSGAASLLVTQGGMLRAIGQVEAGPAETATRPDVAAIDHDRILAAAERYLVEKPTPLTSLLCARSPGTPHDYYSEANPEVEDPGAKASAVVTSFVAHRDALFALGLQVPALASAHLLTGDANFAERAGVHLRAWFLDPATRMTPRLDFGQVSTAPAKERRNNAEFGAKVDTSEGAGGSFEGILETLPLVEIAQAIPFLEASGALTDADWKGLREWFAEYLRWLTEAQDSGPRLGALARDRKDHHGTSWMLQVSAYSLLTAPENGGPKSEDKSMVELRHRFKTATLRAQISADGKFPRELASATPYRNSLFNLDMIAMICNLLSTRFESMWEYQLDDGPSMRGAIAYHFPFMADRGKWPFRADNAHFTELPARRVSLLFAGRAYRRPEYAALWKMLPPDPPSLEVLRTVPVSQPLLWVRQVPRKANGAG